MRDSKTTVVVLGVALSIAVACGGGDSRPSPAAPGAPSPTTPGVQSITDGDTLRLTAPVFGAAVVRLLNIDAPELNGATQEPWARESRDSLAELLAVGAEVSVETDVVRIDLFGRLLAHVTARAANLDANREQLRRGQAVLFFIWPNVARFEDYRAAAIEAQQAGRGIWQPGRTLSELPFEFRRRTGNEALSRPVGDFFTRRFVDANDYRNVPLNNRVFFDSRVDAAAAGYAPCARLPGGDYEGSCFGPAN